VFDKYRLLSRHSELTGYSVKALERKIESGHWMYGKEYIKSPDGRIQVIVDGYNSWVESERSQSGQGKTQSSSSSHGRESNALNR